MIKFGFKKIEEMQGEEGVAYNAELYIDGIHQGHLHQGGFGGDYDFHRSSKSTFTEDQLNKLVKTKEFLDKELDFTEPNLIKWRDMEYLYFQFMKVRDLKKLLTKMKKEYGEEYGMSVCLFAVKRGFVQSKDLCYPTRKGEEKSVYNLLKAEANKNYKALPDYEMKLFTVFEKTDLDKFLEIDIDVNSLTSASEGGNNGRE